MFHNVAARQMLQLESVFVVEIHGCNNLAALWGSFNCLYTLKLYILSNNNLFSAKYFHTNHKPHV